MLIEDGNAIIFRQQQPPILLRLFAIVLGLTVGILIPVPFIIHANWTEPSWTLALVVLCVIIPPVLGAVFIVLGLVSATELRLDADTGLVTRIMRGPVLRRRESYPLSAVGRPDLVMHDSEDYGPYPVLRMRLPKWPVVEMRDFRGVSDAEYWRQRISEMIAAA